MLPLKLVLDTNVIVSAHLNPDGLERSALVLALTPSREAIRIVEILAEYDSVLHRKKLQIDAKHADASLKLIEARATLVTHERLNAKAQGRKDAKSVRASICADL
ncbi:MAG TPA: PIN domain-containing protein [Acidobacteriota bacterium]|jgi:predicted nucleic acid-binding protein|nr:PIN domain-containing protein [Acidobacteriota bacterium]